MADHAPRTIRFDREYWGHSNMLRKTKDYDDETNPTWEGLIISTPLPRVGDCIEWPTAYGRARLTVEATTFIPDPDDMIRISRARITERLDRDGRVLWSTPALLTPPT